MISVVCVYNNKEILKNYLLKSLKNQTIDFELITLDNIEGEFKSAAEALNYGGNKANGKYIMFVHQDVDLCSDTWLEEAEKILDSIPDLGIAGIAGMSEKGHKNEERGRNIIKHGDPPKIWSWGKPIQKPEQVQTLDECLIIIPKSIFDRLQFDEQVCNDWHLYAVDYSLSVRELGIGVYVIPLYIYHLSTGALSKDCFHTILDLSLLPKGYYQTLKKLLKKHKPYFKWIYMTTGDWSTLYPLTIQRIWHLAKAGVSITLKKLRR